MTAPGKETEALVLACQDHGESDRIITFYSRKFGKLKAIAKGANRSKKRFVNKLEPFTFLTISYNPPKSGGLSFLLEAEMNDAFIKIRQDFTLFIAASVIQELVITATQENQGEDKIFHLILWAFNSLNTGRPPLSTLTLFMIRFFDLLGYRPDLTACSQCGITISDKQAFQFNLSTGGLKCDLCNSVNHGAEIALSLGTIKFLNSTLSVPLERLGRLQLSGTMLFEASEMAYRYARQLFQREFQSWKILKHVYK